MSKRVNNKKGNRAVRRRAGSYPAARKVRGRSCEEYGQTIYRMIRCKVRRLARHDKNKAMQIRMRLLFGIDARIEQF